MILTHVLQPLAGDDDVIVGKEYTVQFTFENFGEQDYQIYEISCDKDITILDDNDKILSLPLSVISKSEAILKFQFTIEARDFLPLRIFVTTTEQGRTNHIIRISEKIVETIEEPTSELQIIGNIINLESSLDLSAGEVLTTKNGEDFNPYTVSFDVQNIGVEDLDIYELSFIDHEFNKYDFTSIEQDGGDANCILNGADIGSGTIRTISFDIDLSQNGLFGTDLLSLHNPGEISRIGFNLSEIGYIYFKTNSLKSYYSPIRFLGEEEDPPPTETTLNEGVFIIPIYGTLYISTAIEILSNTEGTYDKSQQNQIVLENLIIATHRRTEQLIIKNYGIDPFNIINIESNYEITNQDALSFYDYETELTFSSPLTINGGETKYLDIRFDDIQMIDDATTINKTDDIGSEITINKVFYKTITITTEAGVFNIDENNQYKILVPFSIYKNQYEPNPYDWLFVEIKNRMSLKDSNGEFYAGSTYEFPYGYGLNKLYPSEQKVTQIRVKNNDLNEIKYFKVEIVDNNKFWKYKPYLVQGGIDTSVDKDGILYFRLEPGEITGTYSKENDDSNLGDNLPILCIVQTNSGKEMQYEYNQKIFDEKYDLKKEGENIVIKVTEGSWVQDDEANTPSDGTGEDDIFIELLDTDQITGYQIERSMVQYIVATWKPLTFNFFSLSNYNTEYFYSPPNLHEWLNVSRPRGISLYSKSSYDFDYFNKLNELYTSDFILPITEVYSKSGVSSPNEYFNQPDLLEVYSKTLYDLPNLEEGLIEGEDIDFSDAELEQIRIYFEKSNFSISSENELLDDFDKFIPDTPASQNRYYFELSNYSNESDIVELLKGDELVISPPDYDTRYYFEKTKYNFENDSVFYINISTTVVFSKSLYEFNNESILLTPFSVQPPSYETRYYYNKSNYTYMPSGSSFYKNEKLELIAPKRIICYSLSNFLPVFDIPNDMDLQLNFTVEKDSAPKTVITYSKNNYKFTFIPVLVELGVWDTA